MELPIYDQQEEQMMGDSPEGEMQPNPFDDAKLLEMWKQKKQEAFDNRWVLEREWLRNLYYLANRQWIHWDDLHHRWVPKRLSNDVPRPVTNMCSTAVQTLRAAFGAIDLGVSCRPVGDSEDAIITAGIANEISPLIHDEHMMTQVLLESDFWMLATGMLRSKSPGTRTERLTRPSFSTSNAPTAGQWSSR